MTDSASATRRLFGTDGIRGTANTAPMDAATALRVLEEDAVVVPPPHPPLPQHGDPALRLLRLARTIDPRQVATSKRGPKVTKPKGYVDGAVARAQVSTARVLAQARTARP